MTDYHSLVLVQDENDYENQVFQNHDRLYNFPTDGNYWRTTTTPGTSCGSNYEYGKSEYYDSYEEGSINTNYSPYEDNSNNFYENIPAQVGQFEFNGITEMEYECRNYTEKGIYNNLTPQNGTHVVKRRNTANKKERRRTQSINNAFADLRDCIPNVPADTKLSKIKTLRLATSYISYLMTVLDSDDPCAVSGDGFKADLSNQTARKTNGNVTSYFSNKQQQPQQHRKDVGDGRMVSKKMFMEDDRKTKGRTGWPQHVWALELKQEQV